MYCNNQFDCINRMSVCGHGRIRLEWILGEKVSVCEPDTSGSGYGPMTDSCEDGNEPSGFIKG